MPEGWLVRDVGPEPNVRVEEKVRVRSILFH